MASPTGSVVLLRHRGQHEYHGDEFDYVEMKDKKSVRRSKDLSGAQAAAAPVVVTVAHVQQGDEAVRANATVASVFWDIFTTLYPSSMVASHIMARF